MKTSLDSRSLSRPLRPSTHAQIAALAYELWFTEGCPVGRDLDFWLESERRLDRVPARAVEADPIPADTDNPDPDHDPALADETDRELENLVSPPEQRSATSL